MKIGIIGGGWRAAFFIRIARELKQFQIVNVYRRTAEKAAETKEMYGVPATCDYESFLSSGFDYVIVSLPRANVLAQLTDLIQRRIPVLVETPPGATVEDYNALWELSQRHKACILVAEQYFCQPYHSANLKMIADGKLGRITGVTNGMMHGYHGISMIRKYMNIGICHCEIAGQYVESPIAATCNRQGMIFSGEEKIMRRELMKFLFENGEMALWDFSGEQYFSYIRNRHFAIYGTRGEICDYTCRYLNKENIPTENNYKRLDTGLYSNMEAYTHHGIMMGDEVAFRNPFDGSRLNDDEIAIATLMQNMNDHLTSGAPLLYPLRDALHDSYLALVMDEAAANGKAATKTQNWF